MLPSKIIPCNGQNTMVRIKYTMILNFVNSRIISEDVFVDPTVSITLNRMVHGYVLR